MDNNQTNGTNGNNETNENKIRKTRSIFVLIAIIVVLVFVIGIIIVVRQNKNKPVEPNKIIDKNDKKEEKPEEQPDEKEDAYEKVDINSSTLDKVPRIPIHFCGGVMFPLEGRDIYLKDLSDSDKLNLLESAFADDIKPEYGIDSIKFALTEKEIKKYFEDTSFMNKIKEKAIDSMTSEYKTAQPIKVEYKDNKFNFSRFAKGCEGPGNDRDMVRLEKAKKNSKYIVMRYKRYYLKVNHNKESDTYTFDIYTSKVNPTAKYSNLSADDVDKADLKDFDSYDVYFIITKGNIRFEKLVFTKAE